MQLAIVADTHIPTRAAMLPADCLAVLRESDLVIHAGDISTVGALDEIRNLCPRVIAVYGNIDSAELKRVIPERDVIEVPGARIGLIHDAGPKKGRLPRMRRTFPDADAVVFGHSHIPLLESDGEFQIFNPGSPTDRRRSPDFTMGIARVDSGRISFEHVVIGRPGLSGRGDV